MPVGPGSDLNVKHLFIFSRWFKQRDLLIPYLGVTNNYLKGHLTIPKKFSRIARQMLDSIGAFHFPKNPVKQHQTAYKGLGITISN